MNQGHNQPPVEQWRLAAEEWVEKDAAARLREEGKTTVLEQYKQPFIEEGDSDAKATRKAKLSDEWRDYIKAMVKARTEANKAKVKAQYLERVYWQAQSADANRRAEMRMS